MVDYHSLAIIYTPEHPCYLCIYMHFFHSLHLKEYEELHFYECKLHEDGNDDKWSNEVVTSS